MNENIVLSPEKREELFLILQNRFENNINRHEGLKWSDIMARLNQQDDKLWSLSEMERTGGEPDVVGYDQVKQEYIFFDCSTESPKGRRSICYDNEALKARKENKPVDSAINMAETMGIGIMTEEEYRVLHKFGKFDLKTQNWIKTPAKIRELGGAIFTDFRFDTIFVYHNGADSYFANRGFRGSLRV